MRAPNPSFRPLLALVLLAPLAVADARQDDPQEGTAPPPGEAQEPDVYIDPRAEQILWSMGQYLGSATAFQVRLDIVKDEPHPSGQWVQVSRSTDVALHRTRGIRASVSGDLENHEFWSDLKIAAMLDPDSRLYALIEVPSSLDATLDHLLTEYGVSWPMADLAYSDPYLGLIEGVEVGTYVGRHQAGGVPCHHLAFQQENVDWQIWIDAGLHPVPRKVIITYKRIDGAPRVVSQLSGWDFDPFLPEAVFRFEPPKGSEQIEIESIGG